jgi:hypothetical protein
MLAPSNFVMVELSRGIAGVEEVYRSHSSIPLHKMLQQPPRLEVIP